MSDGATVAAVGPVPAAEAAVSSRPLPSDSSSARFPGPDRPGELHQPDGSGQLGHVEGQVGVGVQDQIARGGAEAGLHRAAQLADQVAVFALGRGIPHLDHLDRGHHPDAFEVVIHHSGDPFVTDFAHCNDPDHGLSPFVPQPA